MAKFKKFKDTKGVYQFWCQGCKKAHQIWTDKADGVEPWIYNGDIDKPTISPSIKVTIPFQTSKGYSSVCHSFIKDGYIEYLSDCTHELAGKTVELTDI